jgi:ATP-dependent helicase YprA (DUF1998 family)
MNLELCHTLTNIRNSSLDTLKISYEMSIPAELAPPASFWESYTDEKLAIGLRACLALWESSGKKMVPREFQLTATIALMSGQDCLVDVGTGYGKTFCMIIPLMSLTTCSPCNFAFMTSRVLCTTCITIESMNNH